MRGEELLEGMRQAQKLADAAPPLTVERLHELLELDDLCDDLDAEDAIRAVGELIGAREKLAQLETSVEAAP